MARDLTSFAALLIFLYGMCAALPGIAELIHGNQSAIVRQFERRQT